MSTFPIVAGDTAREMLVVPVLTFQRLTWVATQAHLILSLTESTPAFNVCAFTDS
jgi:hypothetical protein